MKWFSPKEIVKEIGKIKWPQKKDLLVNSVQVLIITAFFAAFFYGCDAVVSLVLKGLSAL